MVNSPSITDAAKAKWFARPLPVRIASWQYLADRENPPRGILSGDKFPGAPGELKALLWDSPEQELSGVLERLLKNDEMAWVWKELEKRYPNEWIREQFSRHFPSEWQANLPTINTLFFKGFARIASDWLGATIAKQSELDDQHRRILKAVSELREAITGTVYDHEARLVLDKALEGDFSKFAKDATEEERAHFFKAFSGFGSSFFKTTDFLDALSQLCGSGDFLERRGTGIVKEGGETKFRVAALSSFVNAVFADPPLKKNRLHKVVAALEDAITNKGLDPQQVGTTNPATIKTNLERHAEFVATEQK